MKRTILLISAIAMMTLRADAQQGEFTNFVEIPAGMLKGKAIQQFYISKTEVSNAQYKVFLDALQSSGDIEKLSAAMPDTNTWNHPVFNEPYIHHYFQHKAYENYPVVGVSRRGAELYCEWLTEKLHKNDKENLHAALPTEAQWEYAARGGDSAAVYPWQGNSMRYQKKGKLFGTYLCNFAAGTDPEHGAIDTTQFRTNADVTAPVESYLPNGYKLSNMAGNVAEMIADHDYTKGGSYLSAADKVKISAHEDFSPDKGGSMIGFRPVIW